MGHNNLDVQDDLIKVTRLFTNLLRELGLKTFDRKFLDNHAKGYMDRFRYAERVSIRLKK